MFKIIKKPEFTHDVPINVPVDGGHQEQLLRTRLRALPDEEAEGFDLRSVAGTKEFLCAVIVQFEDLTDAEDRALPYSEVARDALLGHAFVRNGLVQAYVAALTKARLGN